MAKKKISRKKLLKEPDEFITFTNKLFQFTVKYKARLSWALAIVLMLLLSISGYRYFSNKSENKAFTLLDAAQSRYETLLKDKGNQKAIQGVEKDFQNIVKTYGDKNAGKVATVIYAGMCYESGNYEKSIELYQNALDYFQENACLKYLILSSLAYAYEAHNDIENAIKCFESILADPNTKIKDGAVFNLGRLYEQIGNKEKSMAAYNQIISDYPDSIFIEIAKEKVST